MDPALPAAALMRLLAILSEPDLLALAARTQVTLDRNKRIGIVTQLARGLVARPEQSSLRGLSAAERAVVFALARDLDLEVQLEPSARALAERGWLFRDPGRAEGWVLPLAYRLQLPSWEGEEPTSLRRLLSLQGADV